MTSHVGLFLLGVLFVVIVCWVASYDESHHWPLGEPCVAVGTGGCS